MSVKLYRWDDAGAPSLDATPGSLANIFKKCLLQGYGDGVQFKAGAGWTLQESNDGLHQLWQAADPAASGCWLNIDDSPTDMMPASFYYANVAAYETVEGFDVATGLVTGTRRFPNNTDAALNRRYTTRPDGGPWLLATDGYSLWWFERNGHSSVHGHAFFFGDYVPLGATDTVPCAFFGMGTSSATSWWSAFTSMSSVGSSSLRGAPRSYDGTLTPPELMLRPVSTLGYSVSWFGDGPLPYPNGPDQGIYYSDIAIMEGTSMRGLLPGMLTTLNHVPHEDYPSESLIAVPGQYAERDMRLLQLDASNSSEWGIMILDTTGPWR